MVASVAVLSDIHGVLPALDAALAEPDLRAADRIVVTGDIAAGPQPVQVLDRLSSLGDRVVWVRGNCERELVELAREKDRESPVPLVRWAADQLTAEYIELFEAMPHPVTLDVEGFGPVLFCHGTPRDDNEIVLVDTRLPRWAEVFADLPDDVRTIVCGHTHMQFVRLVDRRLVVNAGSIGMPYGRVGAQWALLDRGAVSLRCSDFDIEAARAQIRATCTDPAVDSWTDEYLYSRNSDAEAVTVFGPGDGR
jgi:predicted phosphodiesterase